MKRPALLCVFALVAVAGSAVAADTLREGFARPLPEYSPVPIWWWSADPITPEGVRDQLGRIARGGIHNAMILNLAPSGPLYGSAADEPPFLSEAWWDLFRVAVEEGKKAGVRIWFYDQLGFSGASLQAHVVRDHPEFRAVSLERQFKDVTGPAEVEITVPPGGTALAAFTSELVGDNSDGAKWIWDYHAPDEKMTRYFRRGFELAEIPGGAHLNITCDDGYVAWLNGHEVGRESVQGQEGWGKAERYDLTPFLAKGRNMLAVAGENLGGEGALLTEIVFDGPNAPARIVSDGQFKMSAQEQTHGYFWTGVGYDDADWDMADEIGPMSTPPWTVVAGMESKVPAPLGVAVRNCRSVTDKVQNGTLKLTVPEGTWRVSLFHTMPGGFDYANPDACRALLSIVHGEIEKRFKDELGKSIAGSFQDEFPEVPRFSKRMTEEFRARAGYDLMERLPALYDDVIDRFGDPAGPGTVQIRCAANDIAAALLEDAFFKPLFDWHEKYGMLCGYDQCHRSADPQGGDMRYVDYFKTMRHYQVPGNDMDGDAKPHQGIADLYHRPRVWLEGFHSSGWGQTLEEIATLLHPFYANGSTLFNPHAIYYSVHGSYWEWAPPDTGWRQPYFAHYPVLADYVSRLSYVLSQGTHVTSLAVLRPTSAVHAYAGFVENPAAERCSDVYWKCQESLRAEQLDYLVMDEDSLARAEVADGAFKVSGMTLHAIVLPSARVLGAAAVNNLVAFATAGGLVIVAGDPPEWSADRVLSETAFAEKAQALLARSVLVEDPVRVAAEVLAKMPRDLQEKNPVLHRRIGDRDVYFVLSDTGTEGKGKARYEINSRRLWETPAARYERGDYTFAVDGIPEYWDALTGEVRPLYNYARKDGRTRVETELNETPAPLIALRPATPTDPVSIESDLDVTACLREGGTVKVEGIPRAGAAMQAPAEHRVRVTYGDGVYESRAPAQPVVRTELPGPFACALEPSCENSDGSFAWPPSAGNIPVVVRKFKCQVEQPADDKTAWTQPDFDDSAWEPALASFGPRVLCTGPVTLSPGDDFAQWKFPWDYSIIFHERSEYSLRLGINEDKVFSSALGGKGRIPEEFIDLGEVRGRDVYLIQASIILPPQYTSDVPAILRLGGACRKRAFTSMYEGPPKEVPGIGWPPELALEGGLDARVVHARVVLHPGNNYLKLWVERETKGPLRLYYQILPDGQTPLDPEWIWSSQPDTPGTTVFKNTVEVPGAVQSAMMVVALAGMHKIRVNGELVADQGNFDAYFMSRSERYDIARFLKPGPNQLEIEARDTGEAVGLLLDGLVTLKDGGEVVFVSDASFTTANGPARILSAPSQGYTGDPALLLLRPRPHPLPQAGWLAGEAARPAPFDRLIYAPPYDIPPTSTRYRFVVPPGATRMTLRTPCQTQLFVNGSEVPLEGSDGVLTATLPDPDAPRRVAALRIAAVLGFEKGAAIEAPITFEMGPGTIPLGSWDELGLPHYAGGVRYTVRVQIAERDGAHVVLDLGHVRGSAEVLVNGKPCGTRIWHPYRFDVTDAAKGGENEISILVLNTLGPHFADGHPSAGVKENQTQSGIFGPVHVLRMMPASLTLTKTE